MIDIPVTLCSGGNVKLRGYGVAIVMGYTGNHGVYRLAIDALGEWHGLTIRACWHRPDGQTPPSSLVADDFVEVPASVTSLPGEGCITFEGSDGNRTVTSADVRYLVGANSGTEDGTLPEPGTTAWEAFIKHVNESIHIATDEEVDAMLDNIFN